MPRIVAYTYDADVHCPDCTRARFSHFPVEGPRLDRLRDEHGIATPDSEYEMKFGLAPGTSGPTDREDNPIHPVFDTDEHEFTHCGDCRAEI